MQINVEKWIKITESVYPIPWYKIEMRGKR